MIGIKTNRVFNIIDGGCGNGQFTRRLEQSLNSCSTITTRKARLAGFDFNPMNIAECNENYQGNGSFVVGNLLDVESVLVQLHQIKAISNKASSKTILVLSGSLTRMVMNDLFDALKTLASIARCQQIDYLFGGGVGDLLINDYLAKQFGFQKMEGVKSTDEFLYSRMPFKHFLRLKLDKLRRKNVLDFSFCQDASLFTKLIKYIVNNTILDLSYCHYTPAVEKMLLAVLMKFPSIKIIFQHYDETALAAYSTAFPEKAASIGFDPTPKTGEYSLFSYNRRRLRYAPWETEINRQAGHSLSI